MKALKIQWRLAREGIEAKALRMGMLTTFGFLVIFISTVEIPRSQS